MTDPQAKTHVCDICSLPIEPDKLMCLSHWRMVPIGLRREVSNTWRAFDFCEAAPHLRMNRLHAYRRACEAAVEHVRAQIKQANDQATTSLEPQS